MDSDDCYSWHDRDEIQRNHQWWKVLKRLRGYFCDPTQRPYSYLIVFFLLYVRASLHFCSEIPSGLQKVFVQVFKIDNVLYNFFYHSHTWSSIIFSVPSGLLIDRFIGGRFGIVIMSIVAFTGQMVTVIGAWFESYTLIVLGRATFGTGCTLLISLIFYFQTVWFRGKEIAFVFALGTAVSKLSAGLALFTAQPLYSALDFITTPNNRLGWTLAIGGLLLSINIGIAILVIILDIKGEKVVSRKSIQEVQNVCSVNGIKNFSLSFWLVVVSLTFYFPVFYTFISNGQIFLTSKYRFTLHEANILDSLIFALIPFFSPVVGILVDKYSLNLSFGLLGALIAMFGHIVHGLAKDGSVLPYVAAVLFSCSYALFGASVRPLSSMMMPINQVTTAYSIANGVKGIGAIIIGTFSGFIIDNLGYLITQVYYIVIVSVSFLSLVNVLCIHQYSNQS